MNLPKEGARVEIYLKGGGVMIRGVVTRAINNTLVIGKLPAIHLNGSILGPYEFVDVDPEEIAAIGILKK